MGAENSCGYGSVRIDGKVCAAHRMAWEVEYGNISNGMQVLHKCDTPSCINPKHLFLGTHIDNMKDKSIKKRSADKSGENNGRAKLTEKQIKKIRDSDELHKALAQRYGVTRSHITNLKNNRMWLKVQRGRLECVSY